MDGRDEMLDTPVKLTYDDFVRFPDDGRRHELIDGEHVVTPSPNTAHQRASRALFRLLDQHASTHHLGEVFYAPFDVVLSRFDVVEPDLLFIAAGQADILTPEHVRGAPALVIEILSPGTRRRDERQKRALYEREGVQEYWVVDPHRREIVVHRRDEPGVFTKATLDAAAALTTSLLPGLVISLKTIFEQQQD